MNRLAREILDADTKGNISEDPVVNLKTTLLLSLEGLRYERELMKIIPNRLVFQCLRLHASEIGDLPEK